MIQIILVVCIDVKALNYLVFSALVMLCFCKVSLIRNFMGVYI